MFSYEQPFGLSGQIKNVTTDLLRGSVKFNSVLAWSLKSTEMNLESFVKSLRSTEMYLESFVKSLLIKARGLRCWTVCFSNMCLQFVVLGSIAGFEVLVEVCPMPVPGFPSLCSK